MCMSGGGGSGSSAKSLRRGQLGTAQRYVSTSRVGSMTLQNKGWQDGKEVKTSTILKPSKNSQNWGVIGSNRDPFQNALGEISKQNAQSAWTGKRMNTVTREHTGRPNMVPGFGDLSPKPTVGQTRFIGSETFTKNADGTITATRTGREQTFQDTQWKAKMVKNEQQRVAVDDGSMARKKSRASRSSVANANTASRFSAKRPKTGSLRIDTSGAQVAG